MSAPFARDVLKQAIAQIFIANGFKVAEGHALETIVDIMGQYIETIGKKVSLLAEHDGRTKATYDDLLEAFNEMEPRIQWQALNKICTNPQYNIPAKTGIPDFPADEQKAAQQYGQEMENGEKKNSGYRDFGIPTFLPPFPDEHSYQHTAVDAVKVETDPKVLRKRNLDQRFEVRGALSKIHKADVLHKSNLYGSVSLDDRGSVGTNTNGTIDENGTSDETQKSTAIQMKLKKPKADVFIEVQTKQASVNRFADPPTQNGSNQEKLNAESEL